MKLSLCMIARDSSRCIGAALRSIRPWVDEMIVVDTGSTDDTKNIALACGARVETFPWCDDFSRARNESLRYAQGEWIFWMDTDDTIDSTNGQKLANLVRQPIDASTAAFVMQVHCPGLRQGNQVDVTTVDHVKLFRNLPDIRFKFRIHEQVLPAIRRVGGTVAWTDIFVVHSGSDQSVEGRLAKQRRDLRLLDLEAVERPNHPFVLFNLGMTWADVGDHGQAIEYLRRSIAVSGPDESHLRKAYALLVASLAETGDISSSEEFCSKGLSLFPDDPELLFRKAILAQQSDRLCDAVEAYRAVLYSRTPRHFSSIDRGILGYKARHNLGLALSELGKHEHAELHWRNAIAEAPQFLQGWQALAECLLEQKKFVSLEVLIEKLERDGHAIESFALRSYLSHRSGDARAAISHAERVIELCCSPPKNSWALHRIAKVLFELGQWLYAEKVLNAILFLEPGNPSALRNLQAVRNVRSIAADE